MQQIINFLIRHKNTLLFLLLFGLSFFFTVQSHSYHKSKFISSTNFLTGGIYAWSTNIEEYFHLKEYNIRLVEENKRLREKVYQLSEEKIDTSFSDTVLFDTPFTLTPAKVYANRYNKLDNYILINKGNNDSIKTDYGVITSNGIVGVVEESSDNFSRVISILNSNSAINAQLKKSEHFGTLVWDGKDPNIAQLTDIPRLAPVKKGDTVITNGQSLIFPKGVMVGTVHDFQLGRSKNYYTINVKLFNDMTNIGHVYILKNNHRKEIEKIEQADE